MTLRIDVQSSGSTTILLLSGDLNSEEIDELAKALPLDRSRTLLDLHELIEVDITGVQFLLNYERSGGLIRRCPAFVREWMRRELERGNLRDS